MKYPQNIFAYFQKTIIRGKTESIGTKKPKSIGIAESRTKHGEPKGERYEKYEKYEKYGTKPKHEFEQNPETERGLEKFEKLQKH